MTPRIAPFGTNAERFRAHNRHVVLGHIHAAGAMGRAELARCSGLSTQAISNIIAELEQDGILTQRGRRTAGRGLPVRQYAINPRGGYAFGVEIRPDAIFAALLDLEGRAQFTHRVAVARTDPHQIIDQVSGLLHGALLAVPAARGRIQGAGLVMPGPFGKTGLSGTASELAGWSETDPVAAFEAALDLPVIVENDANAAALAERISGAAIGLHSYACLYFGAGLGLGLVSRGQLVPGAFGNAGEIGHVPVNGPNGPVPLETLASRLSVQRHLMAGGLPAPDIDALGALHRLGHPALSDWLAQASDALGQAIGIIENLFDPQTILLGGAMPAGLVDHLVTHVPLQSASVSQRPDNPHPRLKRGTCGRLTATMGAASLVLNRIFTPRLAAV